MLPTFSSGVLTPEGPPEKTLPGRFHFIPQNYFGNEEASRATRNSITAR